MHMNENKEDGSRTAKRGFRINPHIIFAVLALIMVVILVRKFWGFGRTITQEEIANMPAPEHPEIQDLDQFLPLSAEDDGTFPEDDGVTTVVCFGNNAFSDDRNSPENVCSLFAQETGATVYNCSVPGSYMGAVNAEFDASLEPMDAFSFFRMTTICALGSHDMVEAAYAAMGEVPDDIRESVSLLESIDFRTVDAVFIMYDGSDYLDGRGICNNQDVTDPTQFTGSLAAGISLLQTYYPWVRIIVMSPTYAFGLDDDGSYISSDAKIYAERLSTYVKYEADMAATLKASFVDNLYGTIHEDIAPDYLIDNLHLNPEGRKLLVSRMREVLEKYTTLY